MKSILLTVFLAMIFGLSAGQNTIEIYSVSPESGAAGTVVFFNVSNASPFSSGSQCVFGTATVPVSSVNGNIVSCVAPPNDFGAYFVDLMAPNVNTSSAVIFTYQAPPVFLGVLKATSSGIAPLFVYGSFSVGSEYICEGVSADQQFWLFASTIATVDTTLQCANWTVWGPMEMLPLNLSLSVLDVVLGSRLWTNQTAYVTFSFSAPACRGVHSGASDSSLYFWFPLDGSLKSQPRSLGPPPATFNMLNPPRFVADRLGTPNSALDISGSQATTGTLTGSNSFPPLVPISVSFWMNRTNSGDATYLAIGTDISVFLLSNQLCAHVWSSDVCSSNLPTLGVWTHVVVTHDGFTTKIFLNGALAISAPRKSSGWEGSTTPNVNIAWAVFDDLQIFTRVLQSDEILLLAQDRAVFNFADPSSSRLNITGSFDSTGLFVCRLATTAWNATSTSDTAFEIWSAMSVSPNGQWGMCQDWATVGPYRDGVEVTLQVIDRTNDVVLPSSCTSKFTTRAMPPFHYIGSLDVQDPLHSTVIANGTFSSGSYICRLSNPEYNVQLSSAVFSLSQNGNSVACSKWSSNDKAAQWPWERLTMTLEVVDAVTGLKVYQNETSIFRQENFNKPSPLTSTISCTPNSVTLTTPSSCTLTLLDADSRPAYSLGIQYGVTAPPEIQITILTLPDFYTSMSNTSTRIVSFTGNAFTFNQTILRNSVVGFKIGGVSGLQTSLVNILPSLNVTSTFFPRTFASGLSSTDPASVLTISGRYFNASLHTFVCKFGPLNQVPGTFVDSSRITCNVPEIPRPGMTSPQISFDGGSTWLTTPDQISVLPYLTSATPSFAPTPNSNITISGFGFDSTSGLTCLLKNTTTQIFQAVRSPVDPSRRVICVGVTGVLDTSYSLTVATSAGVYWNDLSVTFYADCPLGTFWDSQTSACSPCPTGTYSDSRNLTQCIACPAGTFANSVGSPQCTPCSTGTFSPMPGASSCTPCAPPNVAFAPGAISCGSCPYGTLYINASFCQSCAPGTFTNGSIPCTSCDRLVTPQYDGQRLTLAPFNGVSISERSSCAGYFDPRDASTFLGSGSGSILTSDMTWRTSNATSTSTLLHNVSFDDSTFKQAMAVGDASYVPLWWPFGSSAVLRSPGNESSAIFRKVEFLRFSGSYRIFAKSAHSLDLWINGQLQTLPSQSGGEFTWTNANVSANAQPQPTVFVARARGQSANHPSSFYMYMRPDFDLANDTMVLPVQPPLCGLNNNGSSLESNPGLFGVMLPGSKLNLDSSVLSPLPSGCPSSLSITVPQVASAVAVTPVLNLSTSSPAASPSLHCMPVTVSLKIDDGCNRRALKIRWSVNATGAPIDHLKDLEDSLSQQTPVLLGGYAATLSGLRPATTYRVTATARNCMLAEGSATTMLVTSPKIFTGVSLTDNTPPQRNGTRAQSFRFQAQPLFISCLDPSVVAAATSSSPVRVSYQWTQILGNGFSTAVLPTSSLALDRAQLVLPSNIVPRADEVYGFLLEASTPSDRVNLNVSVLVYSQPLSVSIRGGDRFVSYPDGVTIEATAQDPDQSAESFTYLWTCVLVSDGSACPFTLSNPSALSLTVPSNTFAAWKKYRFTLTFTKGTRSASASVVTSCVVGDMPPTVSIEALARSKVNPADRLMLKGTAISKYAISYLWTVTSATSLNLTASSLNGVNGPVLALSPNVLVPGASYTFVLSATDIAGTGTSNVTVLVNTPPTAGTIQISPANGGQALTTVFSISSSGFADSDAPLTFDVSYLASPESQIPFVVTSAIADGAQVNVSLPEGKFANSSVQIMVTAYDSLGARTTVSTFVRVDPMTFASVTEQATFVDNKAEEVAALIQSGATSVSQALNVLSCLADTINTISVNTTSGNSTEAEDPAIVQERMQKKQALQERTLSTLQSATTGVEVTAASIGQTTAVLSKLAGNPSEMSPAAKQGALTVFQNVFTSAATNTELAVDTTVMAEAGSTLSKIADAIFTPTEQSNVTTIDDSASSGSTNTTASASSAAALEQKKQMSESFVGTLNSLATSMTNGLVPGQPPVVINTPSLQISAVRKYPSAMSEVSLTLPATSNNAPAPQFAVPRGFGDSILSSARRDISGASSDSPVDTQLLFVKQNPYSWSPSSQNISSSLISMTVRVSGSEVKITGLQDPIVITIPNGKSKAQVLQSMGVSGDQASLATIRPVCRFWNETESKWSTNGCKPSLELSNDNVTICLCDHLTQFASFSSMDMSKILPNINTLDFNEDSKLLAKAENLEPFTLIFLGVLTALYLFAIHYGRQKDKDDYRGFHPYAIDKLKEKKKEEAELERKLQHQQQQPSQSEASPPGTDRSASLAEIALVSGKAEKPATVWSKIADTFKEEHLYLSIWFRPKTDTFTRPQRATIVYATVLATMVVNAMFYGRDMVTDQQRVVAGILSGLIMMPFGSVLIPLFARARPLKRRYGLLNRKGVDKLIAWDEEEETDNTNGNDGDKKGGKTSKSKKDVIALAAKFESLVGSNKRTAKEQEYNRLLRLLPSPITDGSNTNTGTATSTPRTTSDDSNVSFRDPLAEVPLPAGASRPLPGFFEDQDGSIIQRSRPSTSQASTTTALSTPAAHHHLSARAVECQLPSSAGHTPLSVTPRVHHSHNNQLYEPVPSAPLGPKVPPMPTEARRAIHFFNLFIVLYLGCIIGVVIWSIDNISDDSFKSVPSWLCFVFICYCLSVANRMRKFLNQYKTMEPGNPIVREDTEKFFTRTLGYAVVTLGIALVQGGSVLLMYTGFIPTEVNIALIGLSVVGWFFALYWVREEYAPFVSEEDKYWPHWCVYVGYAICFGFSVFAVYLLILYGSVFKRETATSWLLSSIIGLAQDACLQKPASIVINVIFQNFITEDLRSFISGFTLNGLF